MACRECGISYDDGLAQGNARGTRAADVQRETNPRHAPPLEELVEEFVADPPMLGVRVLVAPGWRARALLLPGRAQLAL